MTELITTIVPAYLNAPKPAKSGKGMTPPSIKTDKGDYFTLPRSIALEAFTVASVQEYLSTAQVVQDTGGTWSDALARAEEWYRSWSADK